MGLFEGMVHPGLAWGALLAAVPLLIHLLNRQRHKPMPWAAMRFVLEAHKRTRRRTQFENLLLLLLRMAAVALLAFAVARPFVGNKSPMSALIEKRKDLVLVLDGSASMGYTENVGSLFEAQLERAREILKDFDGTRGDRVRLYLAGTKARLLSSRAPEEAQSMLATLSAPTHEKLDLGAVLSTVVGELENERDDGATSGLEVRILSDLQRSSFRFASDPTTDTNVADPSGSDAEELATPRVVQALDRLEELEIDVVVEDLGSDAVYPANLGVVSVAPLGDVLGPGIPTDVAVTVRNFGSTAKSGFRVILEVDGERLPSQEVELDSRGSAEVVFSVVFDRGGDHTLEARLEGDRLAIDDTRATVLGVPPSTRVLLVNGAPSDDIERDELGYLRVVLEPADDGDVLGTGFLPFLINDQTVAQFSSASGGSNSELEEADVIVLANTGVLSSRVMQALEQRVAAGASVVFTLGDRYADPNSIESFNERAWKADGTGLAPARLSVARISTQREQYFRAQSFEEEHPALNFFSDERWRPLLTEVPISGFVASDPVSGSRVLVHLDDPDQSPLLIERPFDRGRTFLWTSTIDAAWTRLPESPMSFVPLMHELLRYAGRGPLRRRNLAVGDTLMPEVDSFPRSPMLISPIGSRQPIDDEPEEVAEGVWRLGPLGPLDETGLWRIETQDGSMIPLAVEFDAEEGDLERMAPDELEASHPAWSVYDGRDGSAGGDTQRANRGELWRWFAGACLAALILETLWAAWIGRGRRLS